MKRTRGDFCAALPVWVRPKKSFCPAFVGTAEECVGIFVYIIYGFEALAFCSALATPLPYGRGDPVNVGGQESFLSFFF